MRERHIVGGIGTVTLIFLVCNALFGGLATQYVMNFWGTMIKQAPVHAPFIPCAVAGLFLGELTIPGAVLTWLISFVI